MIKHELICSPSLAALENELHEAVKKEKERGPLTPVVVMVGSHLLGRALSRNMAEIQPGILNVRFVTMRQIAEILGLEPLAASGKARPLPGPAAGPLLDHVIEKQKFSYLEPVKSFPGFRGVLMATLRDIRDADLVSDLEKMAAANPEGIPEKTREVAATAAAFFKSYRKKFHDGAELLMAAASGAADFQKSLGAQSLFIYCIYDFTAVQARMIEALASAVPIKVFIPHGPGPSFSFAARGRKWYAGLPGMKETIVPPRLDAGGSLARVQAALSGGDPSDLPGQGSGPDQGVEIIAAPGEIREVEEIAGKILQLAGGGMPFHRMAVILRHPDLYMPMIGEVFDRAGIPFYCADQSSFAELPVGACVAKIIELVPDGNSLPFSRPRVIDLIMCGVLNLPGDEDVADHWRALSMEAGILGGLEHWSQKLIELEKQKDRPYDKEAVKVFRKYMTALLDRIAALKGRKNFADHARALTLLLRDYLDPDLRDNISGDLDDLEDDAAALDELSVPVTWTRFRRAVESWQGGLYMSGNDEDRKRFQEGTVTVGSIMSLRGIRFEAVLAPGMSARSFPAPERQDPILLDDEREAIESMLDRRGAMPLKGQRPAEDRLLFALLAQSARSRLVLTWSRANPQGKKERLPSPLLLETASAVKGSRLNYSMMARPNSGVRRTPLSRIRAAAQDEAALKDRPPLDEAEFLLWDCVLRGMQPPPGAESAHQFFKRGLDAAKSRAVSRPVAGPFLGVMTGQDAQTLLERWVDDRFFSANALEDFAKCPFAFFIKRVMKLDSPEPPETAAFDALERGGLVHDVLKEFMERVCGQGLFPLSGQDEDAMLAMLTDVFEEEIKAKKDLELAVGPLQWRIEMESLARQLPDIMASLRAIEKPDFRPVEFELSFGLREKDARVFKRPDPVPLTLPGGRAIKLCGRIDRLEVSKSGAVRPLDYKTGRIGFTMDQTLRSGTALQGGIYLIAAGEITGCEIDGFCQSGYVYVMGSDARKSKLMEGEPDFIESVRRAVGVIVDGISRGLFCPLPAAVEKRLCSEYCDFQAICGEFRKIIAENIPASDPAKKVRDDLDAIE